MIFYFSNVSVLLPTYYFSMEICVHIHEGRNCYIQQHQAYQITSEVTIHGHVCEHSTLSFNYLNLTHPNSTPSSHSPCTQSYTTTPALFTGKGTRDLDPFWDASGKVVVPLTAAAWAAVRAKAPRIRVAVIATRKSDGQTKRLGFCTIDVRSLAAAEELPSVPAVQRRWFDLKSGPGELYISAWVQPTDQSAPASSAGIQPPQAVQRAPEDQQPGGISSGSSSRPAPPRRAGSSSAASYNMAGPAQPTHAVPLVPVFTPPDADAVLIGGAGQDLWELSLTCSAVTQLLELLGHRIGKFWLSYQLLDVVIQSDAWEDTAAPRFKPMTDTWKLRGSSADVHAWLTRQAQLDIALCAPGQVLAQATVPLAQLAEAVWPPLDSIHMQRCLALQPVQAQIAAQAIAPGALAVQWSIKYSPAREARRVHALPPLPASPLESSEPSASAPPSAAQSDSAARDRSASVTPRSEEHAAPSLAPPPAHAAATTQTSPADPPRPLPPAPPQHHLAVPAPPAPVAATAPPKLERAQLHVEFVRVAARIPGAADVGLAEGQSCSLWLDISLGEFGGVCAHALRGQVQHGLVCVDTAGAGHRARQPAADAADSGSEERGCASDDGWEADSSEDREPADSWAGRATFPGDAVLESAQVPGSTLEVRLLARQPSESSRDSASSTGDEPGPEDTWQDTLAVGYVPAAELFKSDGAQLAVPLWSPAQVAALAAAGAGAGSTPIGGLTLSFSLVWLPRGVQPGSPQADMAGSQDASFSSQASAVTDSSEQDDVRLPGAGSISQPTMAVPRSAAAARRPNVYQRDDRWRHWRLSLQMKQVRGLARPAAVVVRASLADYPWATFAPPGAATMASAPPVAVAPRSLRALPAHGAQRSFEFRAQGSALSKALGLSPGPLLVELWARDPRGFADDVMLGAARVPWADVLRARPVFRCPVTGTTLHTAAAYRAHATALVANSEPMSSDKPGATPSTPAPPVRVRAVDVWVPVLGGASVTPRAAIRTVVFLEDFGVWPAGESAGVAARAGAVRPRTAYGYVHGSAALWASSGAGGPGGAAVPGETSATARQDAAAALAAGLEPGEAAELAARSGRAPDLAWAPPLRAMPEEQGELAMQRRPNGSMPSAPEPRHAASASAEAQRELLEWRAAAEEAWAAELRGREAERRAELQAEFEERDAARAREVSGLHRQYRALEQKLKAALLRAERAELDAHSKTDAAEARIVAAAADADAAISKSHAAAERKVIAERERAATAEARVAKLEQLLQAERESKDILRREFNTFREQAKSFPASTMSKQLVDAQAQVQHLQSQLEAAQAQREEAQASCATLKSQLFRVARELQRSRARERVAAEEQVAKLRVAYLAQGERYVLDDDRKRLADLREQVAALRAAGSGTTPAAVSAPMPAAQAPQQAAPPMVEPAA